LALQETPASPRSRRRVGARKDAQKSAIANGRLLPGIDQRSTWVRRCKELLQDLIADAGGLANTSAAEQAIQRRCAVLIVELERRELAFAQSNGATDLELDTYARVAGNLRRLLEAVGLQRRSRDVTVPDLATYLRHREAAQ
jgi:hypothetical protein